MSAAATAGDGTGDEHLSAKAGSGFLATWERRTGPLLIVAAIAPLAAGLTGHNAGGETIALDLGSWLLFVADYVVHLRYRPGYSRSRFGLFDIAIVVLTAPWYLIPGAAGGLTNATRLGRLGRLGRVFVASTRSRKLRNLARRLGAAALYSVALLVACAIVVERVEPAASGFATFGDAMWWSVVTFTTVGYGDLSPVSTPGRLAGVLLMLGGIALIGSLAGTLGSFFGPDDAEPTADGRAPGEAPGGPTDPSAVAPLTEETATRLLEELQQLRSEVADLRRTRDQGPDQVL